MTREACLPWRPAHIRLSEAPIVSCSAMRRGDDGNGDNVENMMNTARRWARSAWLRMRAHRRDPPDSPRAGLRRAARAALVMPPAFAFAQVVIRNAQVATFVAFGCIALLVMADFAGPRRPRALAYAVTTGIGAVLIALGTLVSFSPWLAALLMLLAGFVVSFAGVFGGYAAAAQTALLLAFVLAVPIPAPPAAIAPRLAGWLFAGVVSTLAGVLLWPHFEQLTLRRQAASACGAVALLIQAQRNRAEARAESPEATQARQAAAVAAVATVRQAFATTPTRPAGPARHDRAFVELLSELDRITELAVRPSRFQLTAQHPCLLAGDRLATTVVQTVAASRDALTGGPAPDLLALQAARRTHREALDRWAAAALRTGSSPEDVLDGLEADAALQVVAYLALALGSDAAIAAGARVDPAVRVPAGIPVRAGVAGVTLRLGQTIRAQLAPTSSVLHTSLRVAVALSLAVLIGRLLQLEHAFWVVLGTLSALRSNALATGRTTVQAIAGTLVGFAIGAAMLVTVGTTPTVLWAVLPVAVFFAAYAGSAIGFVTGQAAFTILVLVLFNLIAPVGWQLGVARVEDVAVGAAISVVVGLLLWPRGARGELRTALAALYRAVAVLLAEAFGRILEPGAAEGSSQARDMAVAAGERTGEALDQYLSERAAKPLDAETAGSLYAAGADAILAADLLDLLADSGYRTQGSSDADTALHGQVSALVSAFTRLADRLDARASADADGERVSTAVLRAAALAYVHRWQEDPAEGRAAVAVVAASQWIQELGTLAASLEQPVGEMVEAARVPWWR